MEELMIYIIYITFFHIKLKVRMTFGIFCWQLQSATRS